MGRQFFGREFGTSKKWTYNDWGTSLIVWAMFNIVLWQSLFIEQSIDNSLLDM